MAKIVWSEEANDDLDELFTYLAARDVHAAERYCGEIERSSRKLGDFPEMGRRYDSHYRILIFRNHLIFYRYDKDSALVTIVAVLDGRRDIDELLSKER